MGQLWAVQRDQHSPLGRLCVESCALQSGSKVSKLISMRAIKQSLQANNHLTISRFDPWEHPQEALQDQALLMTIAALQELVGTSDVTTRLRGGQLVSREKNHHNNKVATPEELAQKGLAIALSLGLDMSTLGQDFDAKWWCRPRQAVGGSEVLEQDKSDQIATSQSSPFDGVRLVEGPPQSRRKRHRRKQKDVTSANVPGLPLNVRTEELR